MIRLVWFRIISKQELYHLLLETTMVFCSDTLVKINFKNTSVCRVNLTNMYKVEAISESNKTIEESQKDGEAEKIRKTSKLDIYMPVVWTNFLGF